MNQIRRGERHLPKDEIINIGIVTYSSLHCNFTNYGTVLQAWALLQAVAKTEVAGIKIIPWLVDYCPDSMRDKSPLNPIQNMWDTNEKAFVVGNKGEL